MEQQTFGFVGVGRMGGLMSGRLLNNGHQVVVYDVADAAVAALEKKGAQRADSAAEVASKADTVFLSLPNPEIVHQRSVGFRASNRSASSPYRANAPGRKFSTTISASSMSVCSSSISAGDLKSAASESLLRLVLRKYADSPSGANGGPQPRVSSPIPGRSTLMTSAPRSPKIIVHSGPASTRLRSSTLSP